MAIGRPIVSLPEEVNIEVLWLTRKIAEALLPDLSNCEGVTCVMGIRQRTEAGEFPIKLRKADLQAVELLLADLPRVHACMSDAELEHFQLAYDQHPRKLSGTLYFASQFDIDRRKAEVESVDEVHRGVLRKKIASGDLNVFDDVHRPVSTLGFNVFMARENAEEYLASINLMPSPAVLTGTRLQKKELLQTTQGNSGDSTLPASEVTLLESDGSDHRSAKQVSDQAVKAESLSAMPTGGVKHKLDDDAPHIPPKTNSIGRVTMKAAWKLGIELNRRARAREVFTRLGEWHQSNSQLAESVISDYDGKSMTLKWKSPKTPHGKQYNLKACQRHIDLWQKSCDAATTK
jgi:hypothetical protein